MADTRVEVSPVPVSVPVRVRSPPGADSVYVGNDARS